MWLGFDLGTQSVRAVAVSDSGELLAKSSQPLASDRHGVRHEQDANEWWRAVVVASRAVLADVPGRKISGLAVDGTSGTILLCGKTGDPLTPALMYDDARAAGETQRVNKVGAAIWQKLGYRMQPSWALPKLIWLLAEHPDFAAHAQLAHQADFINHRLAGCYVPSDTSNAL